MSIDWHDWEWWETCIRMNLTHPFAEEFTILGYFFAPWGGAEESCLDGSTYGFTYSRVRWWSWAVWDLVRIPYNWAHLNGWYWEWKGRDYDTRTGKRRWRRK